jgi:hypothetical protein
MRSNSFSVSIWDRACFEPISLTALTAASMASTAVAGGISAYGTLAGGAAAKQAGDIQQQEADYQAAQLKQNASQAIASGQRQSLDTALKTRLAISTARANAAGNGVNAGTGSAAEAQGQLAKRGSYNAAMDMFNGRSTATGLMNQAAGVTYSGQAAELAGQEQQSASYLAAAGTLAGSAGSMAKSYGSAAYPQYFRGM